MWYLKLKYNEVGIRNFVYCTVTQQYNKNSRIRRCSATVVGCCTSEEKWKQVIRFFIEYGIAESLGERAEHYMPALWLTQETKTICAPAVAY